MRKQRRRTERTKARVPVRVTQVGEDGTDEGTSIGGFTRDISRHGMFIQTRSPFPPGSQVEVEMLRNDRKVRLPGVVVHASRMPVHLQGLQASGMGVRTVQEQERDSSSSDGTAPAGPPTDIDGTRDDRVDPGTRVAVFFGSERRLLALRSLSASGAAVVSPRVLPRIPFVRLHLKLPGHPDLIVDGIPVRSEEVEDGILVAIKFLDPPPDIVGRIEEFVARHRRREQGSS